MQTPLQITFDNLDRSDAIEGAIRDHATKLEKFFHRITACRVAVQMPHRHQRKGRLLQISVDLILPRGELVAGRASAEHPTHADIHIAVRDAFRAARRQLQDHAGRHHGRPARRRQLADDLAQR
ncbi:MAG: ribosome-associated translation inhibitor RaiA [Proteobacteria bacterium]|nr:ribosome-associated translation inhibitor RaiA [Pseudomonadota bacterium]